MNLVIRFLQIHKRRIHLLSRFQALLNHLSQSKNLVYTPSTFPKATLFILQHFFTDSYRSFNQHPPICLPSVTQHIYTSHIFTLPFIAFPLIYWFYNCFLPVLRYTSFYKRLIKQLTHPSHHFLSFLFNHLRSDVVYPCCLPTLHFFKSLHYFVYTNP